MSMVIPMIAADIGLVKKIIASPWAIARLLLNSCSSFVSPAPHDLFLESPDVKLQKETKECIFRFDSPSPIDGQHARAS